MSNCLDQDQDRHSVGPDLGPNCLQRLSADDKSLRLQEKSLIYYIHLSLQVLYLLEQIVLRQFTRRLQGTRTCCLLVFYIQRGILTTLSTQ